jgi:thioredoxin reductase
MPRPRWRRAPAGTPMRSSSAAGTPPARLRCTFPGSRASSTSWCVATSCPTRCRPTYLVQRLNAQPNIEIHFGTEVTALHGGDHLERITVRSRGEENTLPARALFLMIGASPNTGWLSDLVELDSRGFVKTGKTVGADRPFETSRQGIFAIGDVRAGSVKRVASAAGEGSVVVPGIYEFLGDPSRDWDPLHLMSSPSTNFSEVA